MTVAEMLARISSRELSEWAVYFSIEPPESTRDDIRTGVVASTLANIHRDSSRRPEPFSANDFAPKWDRAEETEPEEIDPEEHSKQLLAKIVALNALFGGKDERQSITI